jgi:hypothetical protein
VLGSAGTTWLREPFNANRHRRLHVRRRGTNGATTTDGALRHGAPGVACWQAAATPCFRPRTRRLSLAMRDGVRAASGTTGVWHSWADVASPGGKRSSGDVAVPAHDRPRRPRGLHRLAYAHRLQARTCPTSQTAARRGRATPRRRHGPRPRVDRRLLREAWTETTPPPPVLQAPRPSQTASGRNTRSGLDPSLPLHGEQTHRIGPQYPKRLGSKLFPCTESRPNSSAGLIEQ